jgi:peroxiredoxin
MAAPTTLPDDLLADIQPHVRRDWVYVNLLRHHACHPCREYLVEVERQRARFDDAEVELVGIGFSPEHRLADVISDLGLTFPLVSDPERRWYQAFEVGNMRYRSMFTRKLIWQMAAGLFQGKLRLPKEDIRQVGAAILVQRGVVEKAWVTNDLEIRPSVDEVLRTVERKRRQA